MQFSRELLTESMFYTLLALKNGPKCGTEIACFVKEKTGGRVGIGPGTLYTILGKFEREKLIEQVTEEGRKRTYELSLKGNAVYDAELLRLKKCVSDALE